VAGLSLSHKREHRFRAVLEGIRHNLETFETIGAQVNRIMAVGGGTKSNTWLQIVSDVSGMTQQVPSQTIGASYGDAFLTGIAAGILTRDDLSRWVRAGDIVEPDPDRREVYEPLYQDFCKLYQSTREVVHRLVERG
jgi:xylulokinase